MKLQTMNLLGVMIFSILTNVATASEQKTQNPIVNTKKGTLKGVVMKTDMGKEFAAFRSIPYAKPPIGNLRFRSPLDIEAWKGIYDATKDAEACVQFDQYTNKITGQEDCLYLNVYAENATLQNIRSHLKMKINTNESKLPVMVFIHGGGFTSGTGASSLYGPQRLMDKDIVLVTLNYRLAAFGFLCTEDDVSPGNYGLLDQVQALQWIQENIGCFGGDSNSVTLFGESAGAVSVTLHLVSPLSKGLFHSAIIQSGTAICDWALQNKPLTPSKQLAESLECITENNTVMIECLKQKPALDIVAKSSGLTLIKNLEVSEFDRKPPMHFKPVINQNNQGFLPEHPLTLINKSVNKVPVITGVVNDEGLLVLVMSARQIGGLQKFNVHQLHRLTTLLLPGQNLEEHDRNRLIDMLTSEYLSGSNMSIMEQRISAFSKIFSDIVLTSYVDNTATFLAKMGVPTYVFKLTHKGRLSTMDSSCQFKECQLLSRLDVVAHMDDLQYLFHCGYFESSNLTSEDQKIADTMLTLWTDFAKTKTPSLIRKQNEEPFVWTPALPDQPCYLDISLTPQMINNHLSANPNIKQTAMKTIASKDEL